MRSKIIIPLVIITVFVPLFLFDDDAKNTIETVESKTETLDQQWFIEEKSLSEIRQLAFDLNNEEVNYVLVSANLESPYLYDFFETINAFKKDLKFLLYLENFETLQISEIEVLNDLVGFDGVIFDLITLEEETDFLEKLDSQIEAEKLILAITSDAEVQTNYDNIDFIIYDSYYSQ